MFRYLSAIGMSEYISKKSLDNLIRNCLVSPEAHTEMYTDEETGEVLFEIDYDMDTFGFVMRGLRHEEALSITHALPAVRTFRNYMQITSWDVEFTEEALPVLCGEDLEFGTPIELVLAHRHEMMKRYLDAPPDLTVGLCGLSTSGQILLNIVRTPEDDAAFQDDENWRREMARRLRRGDRHAEQILAEDAQAMDDDVRIRLQNEDVYTILEGLLSPADDSTLGYFSILGTITAMHKIMNPHTEEWVYEFELNVMGTPFNVYINPKDLEGSPSVGMRFQGSVMLIGDVRWDD